MDSPASVTKWRLLLLGLLLVLAAALPELPAQHGQFQWDDEELHIAKAASAAQPLAFFVPPAADDAHLAGNYYPLSRIAFWLEYQAFGRNTTGYHWTNLVLHAGNVLLAWWFLRRLKLKAAWLAAAIFALHPIVVESVVYISELKNLLSACFFLAASHFWLTWHDAHAAPIKRPARAMVSYLAMLGCFAAAMLSKSTTCTFPVAMLCAEYWRSGRLTRRVAWGAAPLIAVGVILGLVFVAVEQGSVGASGKDFGLTLPARLLIAGHAVWFYLGKFVWPSPLLTVYPRWDINTALWFQWLYPAAVAAALLALWQLRSRIGRGPLAGAAVFLVLVAPALGFIDYYPIIFTFVADHYVYLALIPLGVLTAELLRRLIPAAPVRSAATIALCIALAALTWNQAARWQTDVSLWEPTVAGNHDSWYATSNLAYAYVRAGRFAEARSMVEHSLTLKEDQSRSHFTMAIASLRLADPATAARESERAIELESTNAVGWFNYALALEQLGRGPDAEKAYQHSLELDASQAQAWSNLAVLWVRQGRFSEAAAAARRATDLAPTYAPAWVNQGLALQRAGQPLEAVVALRRGLDLLSPAPVRIRRELLHVLLQLHDTGGARTECERIIRDAPQSPEAAEAADTLQSLRAGMAPH